MEQYNYKGNSYETLDELFKVNIEDTQVTLIKFKERVDKGISIEKAMKETTLDILLNRSSLYMAFIVAWTLFCVVIHELDLYYNLMSGFEFIENNEGSKAYIKNISENVYLGLWCLGILVFFRKHY